MSEPITLESLAKRLEAVEATLAATTKPTVPAWRRAAEAFDPSPEAEEARRSVEFEMKRIRAQERVDLGLDDPPQIVWKDWEYAVGVVTDLEGYARIAAAGQAIRQAERDAAQREGTADQEDAA